MPISVAYKKMVTLKFKQRLSLAEMKYKANKTSS